MATDEGSSRKRHRLFQENNEEFEKGLKDNRFHKVALTSLELWQNLGHTQSKGEELVAQLQ
ncbi:3932_t:CDS:2 [Ambispora leptoticha]|uniref:3932_t:CDS:1 n=1 Tax=Ambispora leptoticha TaxID=144679 RepID=A0A9N9BWX0_9GLOM|nr:3932_t:CDS:2 [Ambispora leptoticha]